METIIFYLIIATGYIAIIAGCLYLSLVLLGDILKMTGMWSDFMKIAVRYFNEKRKLKAKKEK